MILWLVALPGFLIISIVSGIVNVMSHIVPAAPCLHILVSVEAIIIAQWSHLNLYSIMWNHSIIMHTGRYRHQSFWNWGLFSSSAEVSGFFKYEFNIKETVLCFWSSLRCIKCWIVIYYGGFIFLQIAVVLLLLESDAACTSLNGHSAQKIAVLVFECCFKARGDREQYLRKYWPPEGCFKQWYDKPTGYGFLSKKCWLGKE